MEYLIEKLMFDFDVSREEAEARCVNTNVEEYKNIKDFNNEFDLNFKSFEEFVDSNARLSFTSIFYLIDNTLYMIFND